MRASIRAKVEHLFRVLEEALNNSARSYREAFHGMALDEMPTADGLPPGGRFLI